MKIVSKRGTSLIYLNPGVWHCHWDTPEVRNRDLPGGEQEALRWRRLDEEAEGVPAGYFTFTAIAVAFLHLLPNVDAFGMMTKPRAFAKPNSRSALYMDMYEQCWTDHFTITRWTSREWFRPIRRTAHFESTTM